MDSCEHLVICMRLFFKSILEDLDSCIYRHEQYAPKHHNQRSGILSSWHNSQPKSLTAGGTLIGGAAISKIWVVAWKSSYVLARFKARLGPLVETELAT